MQINRPTIELRLKSFVAGDSEIGFRFMIFLKVKQKKYRPGGLGASAMGRRLTDATRCGGICLKFWKSR
jgi:hypothetical protein